MELQKRAKRKRGNPQNSEEASTDHGISERPQRLIEAEKQRKMGSNSIKNAGKAVRGLHEPSGALPRPSWSALGGLRRKKGRNATKLDKPGLRLFPSWSLPRALQEGLWSASEGSWNPSAAFLKVLIVLELVFHRF